MEEQSDEERYEQPFEDILQREDPWRRPHSQESDLTEDMYRRATPASPWPAYGKGGPAWQSSGAASSGRTNVMPVGVEPPPQRIIHDVPPVWDGKDLENHVEPNLKLLSGWLSTTRTMKTVWHDHVALRER